MGGEFDYSAELGEMADLADSAPSTMMSGCGIEAIYTTMNPNEFETQTRQEISAAFDRIQTVALLISEMELELVAVSKALHSLSQLVADYTNPQKAAEGGGIPAIPADFSYEKNQDSWVEQDDW